MRPRRIELERFVKVDPVDRSALGAEPARFRDGVEVERRDRRGDPGASRCADLSSPC